MDSIFREACTARPPLGRGCWCAEHAAECRAPDPAPRRSCVTVSQGGSRRAGTRARRLRGRIGGDHCIMPILTSEIIDLRMRARRPARMGYPDR